MSSSDPSFDPIDCYLKMLTIRFFEETVEKVFTEGLVRGTSHTCIGQEGVCVAVGSALTDQDMVTSTHRGHGHFLGKGGDPNRMMAELFGKETGYSRGRGGSQLMAQYDIGFVGGNGITGGSIPVASGMALRFKNTKQDRIALCYFGDGATNQGSFHESLNMAGLWKLPVIYLCENNLYAMSTPCSAAFANPDIAAKAESYSMRGVKVDGNDFFAVRDAVAEARARAIAGEGPTLLECLTYRFSGHSRGDKRVYRTREEENEWQKQEPIEKFKSYLLAEKIIDSAKDEEIVALAKQRVEEAVAFAKESPEPDPATLMEGVFA